ncbi:MAG: hypothetical protein ACJ8BW_13230 [Ktedonobacteraceae bacterium]
MRPLASTPSNICKDRVFSQVATFLPFLLVFQGFLPLLAHSLHIPWEELAYMQTQEERNLKSLESFLQFYDEFQQDQELKEALGQRNASFALSLIYKNFINIYRQLPEKMRGNWFKDFFSRVTQQPNNDDFARIFEEGMRQIIQQISREDAIKLYDELMRDKELKDLLGIKYDEARTHINEELLNEG